MRHAYLPASFVLISASALFPVEITGVSPAQVSTLGGTEVAITGNGFLPHHVPRLGGAELQGWTLEEGVREQRFRGPSPVLEAGFHVADIFDPRSGQPLARLANAVEAVPPALAVEILGVEPDEVSPFGGTLIAVNGAGFRPEMQLRIGGLPALIKVHVSPRRILAATPPMPEGDFDVELYTDGGRVLVARREGAATATTSSPYFTCEQLGHEAVHVVAQEQMLGQTSELFAGAVHKITREVPAGVTPKEEFYLALSSNFGPGFDTTGIGAWILRGAITGDLVLSAASTAGTVAGLASLGPPGVRAEDGSDDTSIVELESETEPGVHVDGFVSAVFLQEPATMLESLFTGGPAGVGSLDPVGTATVLRLDVEATHPLWVGEVVRGRLAWEGYVPVGPPDANDDDVIDFSDIGSGHVGGGVKRYPVQIYDFCSYPELEIELVGVQPEVTPADINLNGGLDISDAVALLGYLYLGHPRRLPCGDGSSADPGNLALVDSNGDRSIDLSDASYILTFLFLGGRPPVLGTEPVTIEGCGMTP